MNVLALDLSLTGTGWAVTPTAYGTLNPGDRRGPERLSWIRDEVLWLIDQHDVGAVALEGYSFSSTHSRAHALGELGGVIRCALYDAGIPHIEVPPATAKKYATGKGNANKNAMLVAAGRRLNYAGESNDEADALWIHAAVTDALGHPWVTVPQAHRDALAPVRDALAALDLPGPGNRGAPGLQDGASQRQERIA